jgi:OmpA-OmpF porin, OOP family
MSEAKPGQEFERDLLLVPVKVGAIIRLNSIFFDFAESTLLPKSKTELDRLIGILGAYPKMEIEIAGHTDNVGDDASNQKPSEARAAAVMAYLLEHGVTAARLRSRGYGRSSPVTTNDTEEGRQLNRRVEFRIAKIEGRPRRPGPPSASEGSFSSLSFS